MWVCICPIGGRGCRFLAHSYAAEALCMLSRVQVRARRVCVLTGDWLSAVIAQEAHPHVAPSVLSSAVRARARALR